ncbi:MAG: UDP-N-acetylglucosamine 2-epimerase [Betaproteobacteria bacterium]
MNRRILAVTGSRAEYGSMRPVLSALAAHPALELELIVTGMHLAPQFAASRAEIESDAFCPLHVVPIVHSAAQAGDDMASALGAQIVAMAPVIARTRPDIVLVQGDRGEMLAAAIAAAHHNIPVAHMSGGDCTGSIDDSIRNAITSFAHLHLTTCAPSTRRLIARGEAPQRVFEVGEPVLDVIRAFDPLTPAALAVAYGLDFDRPVVLATQHPVTTEAGDAAAQVTATLEALAALGLQTIFTYPNTDSGGADIVRVLEAWRGRDFLRLVPHLGQRAYLSLMKVAAVMVGNSSSGILEAASFQLPVVNIGTRQHGRLRGVNVVDAGYDAQDIRQKLSHVLHDASFRQALRNVTNPYGTGDTAAKTTAILARLRLVPELVAKWLAAPASFVD